jgi:glycosyltransferase involved in cell wall biosynthesis
VIKVLIIIYKIEGQKGSEDASGYDIAKGLIEKNVNLEIITRANNAQKLNIDPIFKNTVIHSVDVPKVFSFYKKKSRGIILYYYLWQYYVGRYIKKINANSSFDIIHQLNFHTDWAPHFIPKGNAKIVWGPIMHHEKVPIAFIKNDMLKQFIGELIKVVFKKYFWCIDPFLKISIQNSNQIIYANKNYAPRFKILQNKLVHIPLGGVGEKFDCKASLKESFNVMSVGRIVSLKGFNLTLDSFIKFSSKYNFKNCHLTIIGDGPLLKHLQSQVEELPQSNNITFIKWIERYELIKYYQLADIFLYPSFESQGLVVSEAMGCETPTITLENTGPHFLSGNTGWAIKRGSYDDTTDAIVDALHEAYHEKGSEKALGRMTLVKNRFLETLCSEAVVKNIYNVYKGVK